LDAFGSISKTPKAGKKLVYLKLEDYRRFFDKFGKKIKKTFSG
jgi:hypothetical protein